MAFTYKSVSIQSKWMQIVMFVYSFILSGLAFVFFHYVFMPQNANIWTYYGFIIMFLPVWLIYGTHELVFYLVSKYEGIKYYYECSIGYALVVMICVMYGSLSLLIYKISGLDFRMLIPIIFLPTITVRIMNYHRKEVGLASISALISMFVLTMFFVVYIQSLGGISAIEKMNYAQRCFGDTLFTIAFYGLMVTLTESLPLRFNNMFAFDGYEAFRSGTVQAIVTVMIMFTCFYILMFYGYLQYFMSPV